MPSLRMKTQSTTCCLKEKYCLHVTQKSSMISKRPLSHDRTALKVEVVGTLTRGSQDAILCEKQCTGNGVRDEGNHGELSEAGDLVPQEESSLCRTEFASATCSSSSETIFSPNQDPIDTSNELYVSIDGGYDDLYMPKLETEDSDDSSRGTCKYKACNKSDFYISDMIVSGLPVEGSSIYDDSIDTTFLHDYRFDEPTMFFDMANTYMVMPSLEDTMRNGCAEDSRTCGETTIDPGYPSLYQAIHQVKSCSHEFDICSTLDSDQAECFDPQMFIKNLPDHPDVTSNLQPGLLAKETQKSKSITLVLDLDETLVHSTLEPCNAADFTFPVSFDMKEHTVYVKQRPHLRPFLERVAEMFEVVIFTASQSIYAKQLLDILDPDGKLISRRAYRESCIFSDGCYTKDLTILGVDLAKVVIIDNSPQVFRMQVNNGIPIKSWFDDLSDCALISLLPFLERLADADDVRPIIAERFGNKE